MHLTVYFCGTGDDGNSFFWNYNYINIPTIRTLIVQGCDHVDVCNTSLWPDLKKFAGRFVSTLFRNDDGVLKLVSNTPDTLKLGITSINKLLSLKRKNKCAAAIYQKYFTEKDRLGRELSEQELSKIIEDEDGNPVNNLTAEERDKVNKRWSISDLQAKDPITGITLCGYSRGGVVCFEIARQLLKCAPEIPVYIVADQPVSGNMYPFPGTNASSVLDCRDLTNVKKVGLIIAAYTKSLDEIEEMPELSPFQQKAFKWIHRTFFSQIVPKLPYTAERNLILIPRAHHHASVGPTGIEHLNMLIIKFLIAGRFIVDQGISAYLGERIKDKYMNLNLIEFPPEKNLHTIFGLSAREAYRHLDPAHPKAHLRRGMKRNDTESLIDWWIRLENEASLSPNKSTQDLLKKIQTTDERDRQSLLNLWKELDKWLIEKMNTATPHLYLIQTFRNEIYERLKEWYRLDELRALSRKSLLENKYFLKCWTSMSQAASYFVSKETEILDSAFQSHARGELTDAVLRARLLNWLQLKQHSKSNRYDLVVSLLEQLDTMISEGYLAEPPTLVEPVIANSL